MSFISKRHYTKNVSIEINHTFVCNNYDIKATVSWKKMLTVTWEPNQNHDDKYPCTFDGKTIRFRTDNHAPWGQILEIVYRINGVMKRRNATDSWNREIRSVNSKGRTIIVSAKWAKFYDQCKLGSWICFDLHEVVSFWQIWTEATARQPNDHMHR